MDSDERTKDMQWIVNGTSMVVEADSPEAAVNRAQESSGWHWEATQHNPLPRNEDGFIETSASYGDRWFVRVTYNTDPEGTWVEDDDWSNVTLHGPFDSMGEATSWMEDYPDGDKDIKDMDVIMVNAVRPVIKFTYTAEDIASLLNSAMDDIDEFANLSDEGARDALNLLVNVAVARAEKPEESRSVEDVIGTNYEADPETVKGWIES